ncbi:MULTISPECIES: Sec-independent protein translocase subunit TatA [Microbacterium]|uniref:Sec-independent protein translocase subunit TatA n=1 Tax=Microbacterium TaxID=33882 RepID=UPI002784E5E0|nr:MULTISPECIES: Sec-independent protein translocase subunit TatA [Microbacterium]MDQ1084323.1 sec-independent protein translocase protein TatA [Microbacterium sp. SORGH_AS_0344]MDQ1170401.1 sec-independent protein translocase protein TatA [Microbacterium proteolyticum]
MFGNLTGWHLLVVLAVILLLFGAAKLPALAKSMGQSARVFKSEMKEMKRDDEIAAQSSEAPRSADAGTTPTVSPEPRRSTDPSV